MKKYICECIGTAVLVLFGCGTAVVTGGNIVAIALAFGLAIIAEAYVIGNISGCHVNPAVSLSMLISNKMSKKDCIYYIIFQIIGAFIGSTILYIILSNTSIGTNALGTNGYGSLSSTEITILGAFITEVVLTFVFIYTILGVTSDESKSNVAGIVIGLTLAFVHLIGIPLTGTSVNPARSIGPALLAGGKALSQLWLFIVAPLIGAIIAAYVYKYLNSTKKGVK